MSSNPELSPTVKFKTVTVDSLVRQYDPKPEKDVIYRFSNGREFKELPNQDPYTDDQ